MLEQMFLTNLENYIPTSRRRLNCMFDLICSAEPVRPIDPAAWISHTTALTGPYPHYGKNNQPSPATHSMKHPFCGNYDNLTTFKHLKMSFCQYFSDSSPMPEFDDLPLSASKTDMATVVKVMQLPDSGLEIRDRMWLKITIANAVIGEKSFHVKSKTGF